MNPKIKAFDCVAESRKWRETAGAKLNAMSPQEELAYLHALGERVRSQVRGKQVPSGESLALRGEQPPGYDGQKH